MNDDKENQWKRVEETPEKRSSYIPSQEDQPPPRPQPDEDDGEE